MRQVFYFLLLLLAALVLSSCGAIPTLPPLDSTVTIRTPQFTIDPGLPTATGQDNRQYLTETPAESTSLPPETLTATLEPSSTSQSATKTPFFTLAPSKTATSAPTATPKASSTTSPSPTATKAPYSPQLMNPYYLANFTHPDSGCDWMGVAGQVFDRDGVVQKNLLVKVGGDLAGAPPIEDMTLPLADPDIDLAYGPGGYELTLANQPIASESSLWVQLFNLAGKPISDRVYLVTYDDCQKNLILLNFME